MDLTTVLIGSSALGFGLVTVVLRSTKPTLFKKLGAMKERYGEKKGLAVHVIGYSVAPIVFGLIIISLGMAGESLF